MADITQYEPVRAHVSSVLLQACYVNIALDTV